jgi:hypothetical protein
VIEVAKERLKFRPTHSSWRGLNSDVSKSQPFFRTPRIRPIKKRYPAGSSDRALRLRQAFLNSSTGQLSGTATPFRKVVVAVGLTLGGHFDRKCTSSTQPSE